MSQINSRELLRLYQDGRNEAAATIFDRYLERLIALVRSRIGTRMRRRIDAEDVVQSAYRSFFVHAKGDRFQLAESGDLWRLLASIALNKLHGQIEKQTATKRNVLAEASAELAVTSVVGPEPSAAEAVAMAEEFYLATGHLSADEQYVVSLHLQGNDAAEIAAALGKSERTIRRLFQAATEKMEERLLRRAAQKQPPRSATLNCDGLLDYRDYVLENMIGAGGMGKVFRAREVKTGQAVAVKALHKAWQSDERAVSQFVQEANILARLKHRNIVGVRGFGRFPGGGYFIAMDFVDGTDLQTRLNDGPLLPADALAIVRQVAEAVGYAHENGIVHCDLKPANILLDRNGRVVVTDFGFAFIATATSVISLTGIGGTSGYIAPEVFQLRSNPTPAADVYAIGVLLWVLISGELPQDAELGNAGERLSSIAEIVRRCIFHDPSGRFATTSELLARIRSMQLE